MPETLGETLANADLEGVPDADKVPLGCAVGEPEAVTVCVGDGPIVLVDVGVGRGDTDKLHVEVAVALGVRVGEIVVLGVCVC